MRSHHSPTQNLLERFAFKDRDRRKGRSIWVYEKGKKPRVSSDLRSECAEKGYFAGSRKGEDEDKLDFRFNMEYEIPFNRLLPAFDKDLNIFESFEVKQICAQFVAHLFHRTKARRASSEVIIEKVLNVYRSIANDPRMLLGYAAKISVLARRPIAIEEVRLALLKNADSYCDTSVRQAMYVDDIDRATKSLASKLVELDWSTIRSNSATSFFISDTPIVSIAKNVFGQISYGEGINKSTTEWLLPISPGMTLRVAVQKRANRWLNYVEVTEINEAQVYTLTSKIYGRDYSAWINDVVQRCGGVYKFHVNVFKSDEVFIREDEFDDVMCL